LEFCDISRVSEAITAKRIKIDPIVNDGIVCTCMYYVLFSDVLIALISQGVHQLGGVKQR